VRLVRIMSTYPGTSQLCGTELGQKKTPWGDSVEVSAPDRKNGNLNILAVFLDDICRYFRQGLEDIWSFFGRFLDGMLRGFKG